MVKVLEHSNLLDVQNGIICHQTNCIGMMNGGIALQIRNKWPKVYTEYIEDCKSFKDDPQRMLGHVQDVLLRDGLVVANCYGQVFPGNGLQTSYKAWDIILDKVKDLANYFSLDLHFPWMVGCGLAGGDWAIMEQKIFNAFADGHCNAFIHKL